jgi:hypothetical protein
MAQLKAGSTAGGQVIATQDWVTSTIVDGAPSALNTLNELAAAINDNSSYAASITTALAGKLSTTGKAADSDKLDGYHASSFWRNGVNNTWTPSTNILLPQSANNQEWSFDITRNGHSGGYWQVWDSSNSTLLKVVAGDGKVHAPYGFVGNLQGNITGSAASATTAGSATTATTAANLGDFYTADDWFRATGDNNHVKFYGNSRQMLFRTDGTTETYGGIGGYPFVWTYNGSSSGSRIMILHTDGRLWTSRYGWLDTAFQAAGSYAASSHNHDSTYLKLSGGTVTGDLEVNGNTFKVGRHIDAKNGWSGGNSELFLGWYSDKLVIGNDVYGKHDYARDMPLNSIAVNNPLYSWKNIALGRNASMPTAEWGAQGASTGFIVIEFPVNGHAMIHAEIAVYEYNGYNGSTVLAAGHPWNNGWYQYGSKTLGELGKQVRFAQLAETGVYCIVLGDATSPWTYGQVQLKRIQNGNYYDNRVAGNGTFRIYQGTDEGIFNMITEDTSGSIDVNRAATADSASSAVNADKVDNLHASSFIRSDADDNVGAHTEWQDNYQVRLGNSADFRMWHDGSHTIFRNYNHAAGNIYFQGENTSGTNNGLLYLITDTSRSYVKLYENGGEKLRTVSDGIRVYGSARIDGSTNNGRLYSDDWGVKVGTDNGHIQFGPANNDWAHIYTDRPAFYTNKPIYENNARLATQSYAVDQKNAAITHADTRIDDEVLPAIADVTLASLGFTGATNANYITNNNQLSNGAGYLTSTNDRVYITDSRGAQRAPSYYNDRYAQFDFQNQADTGAGGDGWHALMTVSKWSSFHDSHRQEQIIFTGENLRRRTAISDSEWGDIKTIWDTGNLDPVINASVSNDTITFTRAGGSTFAVTTSDANTNTVTSVGVSGDLSTGNITLVGSGGTSISKSGGTITISSASSAGSSYPIIITGGSTFLGTAAGGNDDGTNNYNVGVGDNALAANTSGYSNVAIGPFALYNPTATHSSVAIGNSALGDTTSGVRNTAVGQESNWLNTTGSENVSLGYRSLYNSMTSYFNTAIGVGAMYNIDGISSDNVAVGLYSMNYMIEGRYNTAVGTYALSDNEFGNNNVALGYYAGGGDYQGTNSVYLGMNTSPNSWNQTNQVVIGYGAQGNGSNTITFGNRSIVENFFTAGPVLGQDFIPTSDSRLKENIVNSTYGLDAVKQLQAKKYNLIGKEENSIGLIAQEVEPVIPEVVRQSSNGYYGVNYGALVPVLVEAIKELEARVASLEQQLNS